METKPWKALWAMVYQNVRDPVVEGRSVRAIEGVGEGVKKIKL